MILILSSWSSGSSAVAGYLSHCGAFACPPLYTTNDPLTPISYESEQLRDLLLKHFDESTLKRKFPGVEFVDEYRLFFGSAIKKFQETEYARLLLKHPLLIYFLAEIKSVHPVKLVVVSRPLDAIENSMLRRNWDWNPMYGKRGAQLVYNRIYEELHASAQSYFAIAYDDFVRNENIRFALVDYCELDPSTEQIYSANSFLRVS